jgi:hypothetical protein
MNDRIANRTDDLTRIGINACQHTTFDCQMVFGLIADLSPLDFCLPIPLLI